MLLLVVGILDSEIGGEPGGGGSSCVGYVAGRGSV